MDVRVLINLFHIMIVAPFLIWVGVSRGNAPEGIYMVLFALGLLVTLYHAYKAWNRLASHSSYVWVNLIHALWVGPLLLYIGSKKKDTPRASYELLLLTAFGALGYHMYEFAAHYDFL
jgi:hypothetical protein